MISAILVMAGIGLALGAVLGLAEIRFKVAGDPLADKLNEVLPQTQCGQCGFAGCRPYAEAMARGEAEINRCPPGGEPGIQKLAGLLGVDPIPFGEGVGPKPKSVAVVDENDCIGCTLCIQACPVDAIIGASKQLHVIVSDICTGCELCVSPCPVDCIHMEVIHETVANWKWRYPVFPIRAEGAST